MHKELESTFERLMDFQDGLMDRMVSGSIRDAIHAHGDISRDKISSASKRICNEIRGVLLRDCNVSEIIDVQAKIKIEELNKEIESLQTRIRAMTKTNRVFLKKLTEIDPEWRKNMKFEE